MLVLPTQQNILRSSHQNAHAMTTNIADLAKTVVHQPDPIIQTLLVTGDLDTLLKFYQMWKEPHNLSQQFVYSWITTTTPRKIPQKNNLSSEDYNCMRLAEQWLNPNIDESTKSKLLREAPIDWWPKITSYIPLNRLKCLQSLAHVWEDTSDKQITYSNVIEWKLEESAILLFEFQSMNLGCDQNKQSSLPMLDRMRSFFPELEFVLRSVTTTAKSPMDRNGTKIKMVTESFCIYTKGEESHLVNHFQVLESKAKTTIYRLHQFDPNAKQPTVASLQLLGQYQHLFRDPSKMAIYRGNTAPQLYHWYSLFNDSSVDVFYEYAQMPSSTMQSA